MRQAKSSRLLRQRLHQPRQVLLLRPLRGSRVHQLLLALVLRALGRPAHLRTQVGSLLVFLEPTACSALAAGCNVVAGGSWQTLCWITCAADR